MEHDCFFSILMCVYNDTSLLKNAINSVLTQSEASLELLILDNSDTNRGQTWQMLNEAVHSDGRVRIYRSDENVGWAKGTAELLQHARGMYVTFVAADDCLLSEALASVRRVAEEQDPDVVWVGNKFSYYTKGKLCEEREAVPAIRMDITERNAAHIQEVMGQTFYESLFHYEKLSFLRREGIDFFEPYWGDCAGMVRALCQAEKMVVLDRAVYGLTVNTSQSRGTGYWDGDQYMYAVQWESIKEAFVRDGYFSFHQLRFCAASILKNELGNLRSMAEGSKCVDRYMHANERGFEDRLCQIKQVLENPVIQEMAQFYGRFEYEQELTGTLLQLLDTYGQRSVEILGAGWLGEWLDAGYQWTDGGWTEKDVQTGGQMEHIFHAVTCEENVGMFGLGRLLEALNQLPEAKEQELILYAQRIKQAYDNWKNAFVQRIWTRFQPQGKLEGQSKVELAAFCKYILDN